MKPDIGTGDIVVGILGAIGVVVLIALFIYVVRDILTRKEGE